MIQKLHRRVFLDKLTRDEATIYISFYVEAANRDAFMAGACEWRGRERIGEEEESVGC